jgi:hypothetical protein
VTLRTNVNPSVRLPLGSDTGVAIEAKNADTPALVGTWRTVSVSQLLRDNKTVKSAA